MLHQQIYETGPKVSEKCKPAPTRGNDLASELKKKLAQMKKRGKPSENEDETSQSLAGAEGSSCEEDEFDSDPVYQNNDNQTTDVKPIPTNYEKHILPTNPKDATPIENDPDEEDLDEEDIYVQVCM